MDMNSGLEVAGVSSSDGESGLGYNQESHSDAVRTDFLDPIRQYIMA